MQAIVNRIGGYYRSHHLMPEEKIQCMEYTIHSILNEISKFVIYGCLFFLLGRWKVYWVVYLCFVSIRLFAGGVHCSTYLQCPGGQLCIHFSVCLFAAGVPLDDRSAGRAGLAVPVHAVVLLARNPAIPSDQTQAHPMGPQTARRGAGIRLGPVRRLHHRIV